MQGAGIWLLRNQRRQFHQPRLRGECFGELIQIDGSDHRWFEDRANPCTLLVFIDDATSTLMELRFVKSESTFSYFEALENYLLKHGRPVAFYNDKHTVFRVAKAPAKPDNLHRALNVEPDCLDEILCWRETRFVSKQLAFSYDRKRIILEETDVSRGLVGKYVDTFAFIDGRLDVLWKGLSLPYTIFDMDQRVTHAAISDNKRLGAVLAHIKETQDAAPAKYPVRINSERMGYKPSGERPGRALDAPFKKPAARLASQPSDI